MPKMSHLADATGRLRGYAASGMHDETPWLPPDYRLDLVGDPDVIILRRSDGTVVARFTHTANAEEIRRAAEEDHRARAGNQDP
jgi:hypothetical protein